jgi:hypothetical protein
MSRKRIDYWDEVSRSFTKKMAISYPFGRIAQRDMSTDDKDDSEGEQSVDELGSNS